MIVKQFASAGWAAPRRCSTSCRKTLTFLLMITTAEVSDVAERLAELVQRVRAGDEVLITQGSKPVARLVPAAKEACAPKAALQIRSLKGHRVLTPIIGQTEIAEEMFRRP